MAVLAEPSHLAVQRFERELEEQVKRHQPLDLAIAGAAKLARPFRPGYYPWPPHEILHAIEACCAYRRGHRQEPLNDTRLGKIVSVFRKHTDPYLMHALRDRQDLYLFLHLLGRQQLDVQMPDLDIQHAIGRYFTLFVEHGGFTECELTPQRKYALSFDAWGSLVIGVLGQAMRTGGYVNLERYGTEVVNPAAVQSFVQVAARTPEEMGRCYTEERAPRNLKSPHMRICIRSQFLDTPLLNVGGHCRLFAPHPPLLVGCLFRCLDYMLRTSNETGWVRELGSGFERYIRMLVQNTWPDNLLERPDKIVGADKACDLLLELADCVLLIECKATRFEPRLIVKENLRNDTACQRIQEAVEQLVSTGIAVKEGRLPGGSKPIYPMIVTVGEFVAPNSDWFWGTAILPSLSEKQDFDASFGFFRHRPQILSVKAFELLVRVLRNTGHRLSTLVGEQVTRQSSVIRGDYAVELGQYLPDDADTKLRELEAAWSAYMRRLRVIQ